MIDVLPKHADIVEKSESWPVTVVTTSIHVFFKTTGLEDAENRLTLAFVNQLTKLGPFVVVLSDEL